METEKKQQLLNSIKESQLVLVGLGAEFRIEKEPFVRWEFYQKWREADKEQNYLWMEPFLHRMWLKQEKHFDTEKAYASLAELLEGTNYFIVTLCTDGMIYKSGLAEDRIVAPCGNMENLQCSAGCTKELYPWENEMEQELTEAVLAGALEMCRPFLCPHCGRPLVWNTIDAQPYNEASYLPMWERYTKWLQGMLNHRVCILEAGVDFSYPSVIRWPFEKMAYFNQKADFYRIQETWYQMPEELKEKGNSISHNSRDFFVNLFV
ncbi:MAG: hypothetical protein HDR01_08815 [Lachnospiraceae bacterium]|nr:hypothetical protein [Lachnospiraceae bacterium]